MQAQFEIKTERTWPNFEPSERAKNTREYVLRQFGRSSWKTDSCSEMPDMHITHARYGSDGQKLKDGKKKKNKKKVGWFPDLQHACGSTQKPSIVLDAKIHHGKLGLR